MFMLFAAMVELVDTLDSKSGVHYERAGSSPARGTIINSLQDLSLKRQVFYLDSKANKLPFLLPNHLLLNQ